MSGALVEFDDAAIRAAREKLIHLGVANVPNRSLAVAAVIERSWRRSIVSGTPVGPASFRYIRSFDPESLLGRAARPVLQRLEEDLSDIEIGLFLSDQSGQIIQRLATTNAHRSALDAASAAEGFDFSELSVGTNGLGTTIQEQRPLLVRGSEHFNDALVRLACAGAPLRHPVTHHIVGSLSIACRAEDGSRAMLALAIDAARQIEQRLVDVGSDRDRAMLQFFDMMSRSSLDPLLVLSEEAVLSNAAALSYLTPGSHSRLWESLCLEDWTKSAKQVEIDTPTGRASAFVERIGGASHSAFALRIKPGAKRSSARRRPEALSSYEAVIHTAATAVSSPQVFAVSGPPGSGKTYAALRLLRAESNPPPLVIDASTLILDIEHSWFGEASAAMLAGRHVIIRHLEDIPLTEVNRVKWLADRALHPLTDPGEGGAKLALTFQPDSCAPEHAALVTQLATPIELPPLRSSPNEIPSITESIVREMAPLHAPITFSAAALQSLMRWTWPGNVAELRRTVGDLIDRFPGETITNAHLPRYVLAAPRQRVLSSLEGAERREIIAALDRSGGNYSAAAKALGLGRTTLYRKLHLYGVDGAEKMRS